MNSAGAAQQWLNIARSHYSQIHGKNISQGYVQSRLAAEALETVLHLQPNNAKAWGMGADIYHKLGLRNFSFTLRAIECCHAELRLRPTGPDAVQTLTNLAKILGEAGRHKEAVGVTEQAARLGGNTLRIHVARSVALKDGKRDKEAQASFRRFIARPDAATMRPELPDAHNFLAVSLVASATQGRESASDDMAFASAATDGALHASRLALRLEPACTTVNSHNYYQVLASILHARHGMDLAAAALWPVAATAWGVGEPSSHASFVRAGLDALASSQHALNDSAARAVTLTLTRSLGSPFALSSSSGFTRLGSVEQPSRAALRTPHAQAGGDGQSRMGQRGGRRIAPHIDELRMRWRAAQQPALQAPLPPQPPQPPPRPSSPSVPSLQPSLQPSEPPLPAASEPSSPPIAGGNHGKGLPARPSGVIAYVCCADAAEVVDMRRSIRQLHAHFNREARYPVVIFHDMLTAADMLAIRHDAAGLDAADAGVAGVGAVDQADDDALGAGGWVSFQWLDASLFALPAHMSEAERAAVPTAVRGYGMGYRHMCRAFCGPLFRHPALSGFEFIWRLDSDSFLLNPPLSDPFVDMREGNASYAWVHAYRDEPVFVTGLWEHTKRFLDARGIDSARIDAWVPGGHTWVETPMCFATNCFVARLSWLTSPEFTSYFEALDATNGFYAYRWGDACVHMLAVAALLPSDAVLKLRSLSYWHQGTVLLPTSQREAARALLPGARVEPMFAREQTVEVSIDSSGEVEDLELAALLS